MARTVSAKGNVLHLIGPELNVGDDAPNITWTQTDMSPLTGSSLKGKVVLLSVTPSLDTSVCDAQARRFNQAAAALGEDVVVVNVSVDLPMAIKRWCGAAGADNILAVSDYKEREFGQKWGLLIDETKLLARSVWIVGRDGRIVYKQIVPELPTEPNYDEALEALKAAV